MGQCVLYMMLLVLEINWENENVYETIQKERERFYFGKKPLVSSIRNRME